jgi:mono/diheme cytochrome c family protein
VTVPAPRVLEPFPLIFDAEQQEITAEPGWTNLVFAFRFTNTSPTEVTLDRVHASCGCTTPRLAGLPWRLAAGTNGSFEVAMDVRGKRGQISKAVYVYTSKGFKALTVRAILPVAGTMTADRARNLQLAAADRQAVFRGDCARCHAHPAQGKQGRELYQAVCAVCHEAEHRADMVPDLRLLKHATDAAHWRQWATHGKSGTLMPAFADSEGGPLSAPQIDSLVDYLTGRFPSRMPVVATPAAPALPAASAAR